MPPILTKLVQLSQKRLLQRMKILQFHPKHLFVLTLVSTNHSVSASVGYIVRPSTRREAAEPGGEFHQFKCKSRFVSPHNSPLSLTGALATWHVVEFKTEVGATLVCYVCCCSDVELV